MKVNKQELFKFLGYIGLALLISGYFRYAVREIWSWIEQAMLIGGGVLVVVSVVVNFSLVRAYFRRRSTRLGTNTLVVTLVVAAILIMINFLGFRHSKRFDLTEEQLYTLSDQTQQVLTKLSQDVKIMKFDKTDEGGLRDLMQEYEGLTRRVKYQLIDPQEKPEIAKQYAIARMGEVIAVAGARTERIEATQEQDITNAIMKVTRDKVKTICFVDGHGEKSLTSREAEGLGAVEEGLKNENYQVKSVNLVSSNQVPSDCTVLVVAGPQQSFFPQEVTMITKFLDEGGKVLLLIDPDTQPGMDELLKKWGIELGNDTVVDASGVGRLFGTGPAVPLVMEYGSHAITKRFERTMTFFPFARSVKQAKEASSDAERTELLKTSPQSWAETEVKGQQASFDEGKDTKGPVTLGIAATKKVGDKQARLAVYGDSDFATNQNVGQAGNGDLVLNTVNWLAQDEDLISVRPKSPKNRRVTLTETQQNIVFWSSLILLPGIMIVSGIYVWWKRR